MLIWSGAELISLSVLVMLLFTAANKDRQDAKDTAQKKICFVSEVTFPAHSHTVFFRSSEDSTKVVKL